jgi:hypothetical protein
MGGAAKGLKFGKEPLSATAASWRKHPNQIAVRISRRVHFARARPLRRAGRSAVRA